MAAPGCKQVLNNAMNDLTYSVSTPSLWFEISTRGTDLRRRLDRRVRDQRNVKRLQIRYGFLDAMQSLCGWLARRLFLGRTKQELSEFID